MKKIYLMFVLMLLFACASTINTNEYWITNNENEKIYVRVDGLQNRSYHKLVFIQHGLASDMNHITVQEAKKAFLNNNYVVVTFDDRYSIGKSGQDVQQVKLSTFENDLETVVNWSKTQPFYVEKFALSGHSLGGASVIQFSALHPNMVDILIPITPVLSGNLWERTCMSEMKEFCLNWKKNSQYEYRKNDIKVLIPYSVVNSCMSYNAYQLAKKIKAKTLLISSQNDKVVKSQHVEKIVNFMQGNGKSVVIQSSGHNFEKRENQIDLYNAINDFIK